MITCGNCGSTNEDNAVRCSTCGHAIENAAAIQTQQNQPPFGGPPPGGPPPFGGPPNYGTPRVDVPNYLAQSIIVTVVCCMPAGIPAIVFAAQSMSKSGTGDIAGALGSASKAKTWCWVSFWLGISWVLLWLVLILAGAATSFTTSP